MCKRRGGSGQVEMEADQPIKKEELKLKIKNKTKD